MATSLAEALQTLDQTLHFPAAPRGWFVPLDDILRIDTAIQQAAQRLSQQPAQLADLLPSLRSLHRHRRACVRGLVDTLTALPGPQLAERLTALALGSKEAAAPAPAPAEPPCQTAEDPYSAPTAPGPDAETEAMEAPEATPAAAPPAEAAVCGPTPASLAEATVAPPESAPEPAEVPEVEPVASAEEPTGSAPVDLARISEFSRMFRARQLPRPALAVALPRVYQPASTSIVRDALDALGPAPKTLSAREAPALRDRLSRATADLTPWRHVAAAQQIDLLTLFAAITRDLQERLRLEIPAVFSRLAAFSEQERPGYVHGLARLHAPRHGHWLEDARRAERSLRRWLGEEPKSCATESREQATPTDTLAEAEQAGPAADWPWWGCTRGRRAVLVGGSPRDHYQRRLAQVFGFSSLDWVDGEVRRIKSLSRRIEHGGIELVLIVRQFTSHKVADKIIDACKQHHVPFAAIDHGHGVNGVQRAIERFLPIPPPSLLHAAP